MDPEATCSLFCAESGFSVAHGMSAGASSIRKTPEPRTRVTPTGGNDPLIAPSTPFLPERESVLSRIEPGAIGSILVLVALISAIGYGGWSVLNEIQRVQFAPVENTPNVLTDLDPLDAAAPAEQEAADPARIAGAEPRGTQDGLDRLYRPDALDVPVMVARDGPISTLDPSEIGTFRRETAQTESAPADTGTAPPEREFIDSVVASVVESDDEGAQEASTPQVVADPPPGVRIVAVRPAWVRVRAADGSVVFEGILNGGDTYEVAATEEPPTLRVGESGAVYFQVDGKHYGPVGPKGSVTSDLALSVDGLTERYSVADLSDDRDLSRYVARLEQGNAQQD